LVIPASGDIQRDDAGKNRVRGKYAGNLTLAEFPLREDFLNGDTGLFGTGGFKARVDQEIPSGSPQKF
jgi:hypothetical protein